MRKQSNGKVRRTKSEWEAIIEHYEKSGLSAAAYCRREEISKNTFSKWKARIETAPAPRPAFVELRPEAITEAAIATHGMLEIELPGGITLRWRA
jgi:hypothetical protein